MSCEHLICAHCGGPVVEARCPACRASKGDVHHHNQFSVSPQLLIAVTLILLLALLIAARVAG
jgi:hypothetical protein